MPDIIFNADGKEFAIEVETGKISKDKSKMKNKLSLLNKKYKDNWFFFVTDRNIEKRYKKLGETYNKRNIKMKIRKVFKNSKK